MQCWLEFHPNSNHFAELTSCTVRVLPFLAGVFFPFGLFVSLSRQPMPVVFGCLCPLCHQLQRDHWMVSRKFGGLLLIDDNLQIDLRLLQADSCLARAVICSFWKIFAFWRRTMKKICRSCCVFCRRSYPAGWFWRKMDDFWRKIVAHWRKKVGR